MLHSSLEYVTLLYSGQVWLSFFFPILFHFHVLTCPNILKFAIVNINMEFLVCMVNTYDTKDENL